MSTNSKKRLWVRIVATALAAAAGLWFLQKLLVPKYVDGIIEGAFISEYYEEEKDFDLIFVGDCEVYENFSPVELWRSHGINSYIRGSAEQYIWQSYYLLEDTLRYQTPKAVVFNVLSMMFDQPKSEAYNRMSLEGMKWSPTKVKAIQASMTEEEHFLDYVFPILRYHSRWSDLKPTDLEYLFHTKTVSHNGYYMRVDVRPAENVPEGKPLPDYRFGDNAWKYLGMMADLCEEKGVELILIKAPSLYPYWYEEWEQQIEDFAAKRELPYINMLEKTDEIGLDYNRDTYDSGLHLNLSGAEKLSRWFGQVLKEDFGLPDRRGDEELEQTWQENIQAYEAEKQAQYIKYGMEEGQ